jgi:thioredoxin 1
MNRTLASTVGTACLLLALTACGSQSATSGAAATATSPAASSSTPAPSPSASTSASASASEPSEALPTQGAYIEYAAYAANPATYSAGDVVLFFHASWCPTCREANKNLTADPASLPAGLTVVKTDFDSQTDLRQKYGVGLQHTFVQIDPDGNELRTWTGSNTGEEIARKTV